MNSVLENGEFNEGQYCHVFVGKSGEERTRAAFIVSSKTARRAVDRNRIKRLMRESLRGRLGQINGDPDLVLLATRRAHAQLKRQNFDEDLDRILTDAGLISNPPQRDL